jgi:hypothetical protein
MYEDLDILEINIRFTVRLPKIYLGSMCTTILSPNIAYRHSATLVACLEINTGARAKLDGKSPEQTFK